MSHFSGKRILFFAPNFFGYENDIHNKLLEMGASVDYFDERPSNKATFKAALRLNAKFIAPTIRNYYNTILKTIDHKKYDYVFIVNAEAITSEIAEKLRKHFPAAKFVLYMWDSIRNKKNTLSIINYFDNIYSFDRFDVESINALSFRPLFYSDIYKPCKADIKYDVVFSGTSHGDRFQIIEKLNYEARIKEFSFYRFLYLHSPIMYYYQKYKDKTFRRSATLKDFSFDKKTKEELISIMCASKAVLDIQHPKQTGLTMRTFEVMAMNKKLITTNADIVNYEFYNPNNILIINRDNPAIEKDFFNKPYCVPNEKIMYKYSIEAWLKQLLA